VRATSTGRAMNAATPLLESDHLSEIQSIPAFARFSMRVARAHGEPCRPLAPSSHADALHHGSSQPRAGVKSGSKGPTLFRAATPCRARPRDRPTCPKTVAWSSLTVEENILLPAMGRRATSTAGALDFLYDGSANSLESPSQGACAEWRPQKLVALGRALGSGTKCLLARRTVRRNRAGAFANAVRVLAH